MNIQVVIKKQLRLLPIIVAGMALASCETLGMHNFFGSSARLDQSVDGPHRSPIYNPHGAQAGEPPVTEALPPPAVPAEAASLPAGQPPSAETDPYDYYDTHGNEITPPAPAQPANSAAQGSFFGRLFSPANTDGQVRKPLPGNPYYSRDTAPVAPLSLPPQSSAQPSAPAFAASSDMQTGPPKDNREPPVNSPNIVPTRNATASNASQQSAQNNADASPPDQPSWWERWWGKHSGNETDPARSAPTPALSSVPPTPPELQAVKDEKLQDMQDLQGERIEAEQEKEQLDSEPSQPQPLTPVDAPVEPAGNATGDQSQDEPADAPALQVPDDSEAALPMPTDSGDSVSSLQQSKIPALVVPASVYSPTQQAQPALTPLLDVTTGSQTPPGDPHVAVGDSGLPSLPPLPETVKVQQAQ